MAAKGWFHSEGDSDRQSIAGMGFRPVALLSWWAQLSESGASPGNSGGIGFWTEAASASVAWSSEDGAPLSRAVHLTEDAALLGLRVTDSAVTMRAEVETFDEDGLTLRYTLRPAERWVVHYLALGGTHVRHARVGWATRDMAMEDISDSGLLVLLPTAGPPGAVSQGLTIGIGAIGKGGATAGYRCLHNTQPGTTTGFQWPVAADRPPPGIDGEGHCFLQIAGLHAKVGTGVSPAEDGTRRTSVGFRPDALVFFSWGLPHSKLPKPIGRLCVGAVANDSSGCVSWEDRNTPAPETRTHVRSSTERVLVIGDTRSDGVHAQASMASIDTGGFTLDWENDGRRREFVYVALKAQERDRGTRGLIRRIARVGRSGATR